MRIDKSSVLIEEYLLYLTTIKGRSLNTVIEYRIDLTLFFVWLSQQRTLYVATHDLSFVNIAFIQSISIFDMYGFLAYCQNERQSSAGTRARKIVSIRQFWRYLHSKAHLLECNIAEQLETPKRSKRSPKYLTLAGLDPACISAHKLRHTAATLMYKYGHADIRSLQQILGHERIATTEIYTHIDDLQMQTAVNSNPLSTML